ncbi:kynurenine/alpha-aminoadipate aminotransferase, mitochondrial [Cephus cinctus]|uniref:Kynurenine/alpha-aminoadipate aminotransferase, mitochondrial n=1 Tax=Cephus cinctus TaxID=211228 RepID=A0AAJ7RT45_CEPCN|nr:kynurenine/alpha-aminoadipate aminotransferase, mitochondrial [Cephus cinctus]
MEKITRRYMASCKNMDYSRFTTKSSQRRKPNLIREMTKARINRPDSVFLAGGLPNTETFPFANITVTYKDGQRYSLAGQNLDTALQYGASQGYPPLLQKMREFQIKWHNPPRNDWDLALTTGSQDACCKAFDLLLEEGDPVMVQRPTYAGIIGALNPLGVEVVRIDDDADGIIPEGIETILENRRRDGLVLPKVLYVNPTGANPTGTVLSEDRRKRIYELAQRYDFLILEDDAYFFLHFLEKPPTSFFSLDTDGRVIRFDSFSKIISAGLRVGVITAPQLLLQKIVLHIENSTLHTSSLSQVLLYKLFESWKQEQFEEHFQYIQQFYKKKRDIMLAAVEKHFTGLAEWNVPNGGMFVWIKILGVEDVFDLVMKKLIPNGVFALPGNAFNFDISVSDQHLRLCYSYATPDEIDKGLSIIAKLIREETNKKEKSDCV